MHDHEEDRRLRTYTGDGVRGGGEGQGGGQRRRRTPLSPFRLSPAELSCGVIFSQSNLTGTQGGERIPGNTERKGSELGPGSRECVENPRGIRACFRPPMPEPSKQRY